MIAKDTYKPMKLKGVPGLRTPLFADYMKVSFQQLALRKPLLSSSKNVNTTG